MHRSGSPVIQFVYSRQYLIGILSGYLMAAILLHYQHPNCPVEKCPVGGKFIVSRFEKSSTLSLWSARCPVIIPREEDARCKWHPKTRRIHHEAICFQRAGDCERNSKWSDFHYVESSNWTKERSNSLLGCNDAKKQTQSRNGEEHLGQKMRQIALHELAKRFVVASSSSKFEDLYVFGVQILRCRPLDYRCLK